MKWKKLRKWVIILLIVYVAGGIALYFLQDAILFHPVQLKRSHRYTFDVAHQDLNIPLNNSDTINLVQFSSATAPSKGLVLYFHGNRKNIGWYEKYTPRFTNNGYEVLMIDYPGFGKSKGRFTEKTLYEWARHVYRFGKSRYPADQIIIYGKSMGTGIAAWLASREECHRLILETPYYDMPSVVQHYLPIYPIRRLLHYRLPTYEYLPYVSAPVSIFHGTNDGVISYKNATRLKPLCKAKDEFVTIDGGSHNNLVEYPLFLRKLDSLLAR